VAAAGHVPAKTSQWGIEIPTTVSKVVLWLGSRGPRAPEEGDAAAVAGLPGVQEVFRGRRVRIFSVGTTDTASVGGQPRRCHL
jgi:hypothetical protein